MTNYSIAGKRGQWPAPEDTSLSYLILSSPSINYVILIKKLTFLNETSRVFVSFK